MAEEEHPTHGGHLVPLVGCDEVQGLQVPAGELADRREQLGSSSEIQGLRVESRHRLLVEGFAPPEAAELLDQLAVGPAVGGANPHVHAAVHPLALEVMRAARAWVDLHRQQVGAPPRGAPADRVGAVLLFGMHP